MSQRDWVTVRHPHFSSPHCVARETAPGDQTQLDLTLQGYRVVRGRVVDEAGRVPHGCELRVINLGGGNHDQVWTKFFHAPPHALESDGSFEVRLPLVEEAVGGLWLRASAPGYADVQRGPRKVSPGKEIPSLELTLVRGEPFELRVHGPSGAPVPGAQVRLVGYDSENGLYQPRAHRSPTDAQGRTVLPNLPAGRFFADVSARGFAPVQVEWVLPGPTSADVTLAKARTIEGLVRTESGEPAAGARVQLTPLDVVPRRGPGVRPLATVASAVARSDGTFTLEGLATGRYRLKASPSRDAKRLGEVIEEGVSAGAQGLVLVLPTAASVRGRVRTTAGYPVPDVTVRAFTEGDPAAVWETKTNPDGTFLLGGLRGERFLIRVETPRWGKFGEFRWAEQRDIEAREEEVDFILARGASIEGRVVNEAGKGVPGLPIGTREKWVVTGDEGAFILRGLRDGPQDIRVQSWSNRTGYFRLTGATAVEAGTRGVELRAAK